jgi:hypothetical protein
MTKIGNSELLKRIYIQKNKNKVYGLLVLLGFDVTTFTPITYQRSHLLRPLKETSSRGWLRT